jgi:hypothetical protein
MLGGAGSQAALETSWGQLQRKHLLTVLSGPSECRSDFFLYSRMGLNRATLPLQSFYGRPND